VSAYLDWIRGMSCVVPTCSRLGEPHHVRSRGGGGRDCDCVPICRTHHNEGHTIGWATFQKKYGVRLGFAAQLLHGAWLKPRPPGEN
jgi:hypothetical protein